VRVSDIRFSGWGGHRIGAWLLEPVGAERPGRGVVQYLGYYGGRSLPHEWLTYPAAGYVTLMMDTRGQGAKAPAGVTPDPVGGSNGQVPGVMIPRHPRPARLLLPPAVHRRGPRVFVTEPNRPVMRRLSLACACACARAE
jgi:hypothetical protein